MSEILNERGRARAGEPRVRRAHSVRAGERGRARAGGASLLAAERDWRERRRERRRERGRATSSTGALGARRRTSGEHAGFDDSARSAEAP